MKGWLSIAAVVVAYDAWAIATDRETLSAQYRNVATAHPALAGTLTSYMVAHLWGRWPRQADPFSLFALAVRQVPGIRAKEETPGSPTQPRVSPDRGSGPDLMVV